MHEKDDIDAAARSDSPKILERKAAILTAEMLEKMMVLSHGWRCLECGKCTANCPISGFSNGYSPRRIMSQIISGNPGAVLGNGALYECLTCGLCNLRCPSDVDFSSIMKDMRTAAAPMGATGCPSHGGFLQSMMRLMAAPNLAQKRTAWITEDLKVAETGDVVYFVGCLPYFDAFFSDIKVETLPIAKGTVKLLNRLGITPVVMKDERCCGHDLLWNGDRETFKKLADLNAEALKKTGAKTVVTACAECYRTLKLDYPKVGDPLGGVEIFHISEFLAAKASGGELKFGSLDKTITFQDPCRLGRQMGVFEEPRKVLGRIPKLELKEMYRSLERASCCGTSSWMNCTAVSKRIQAERLKEARGTGADLLVTSCPKCYIHFQCTLSGSGLDDSAKIEVIDLVTLAASTLE
jgi:heterodisulfide reductase subunit D